MARCRAGSQAGAYARPSERDKWTLQATERAARSAARRPGRQVQIVPYPPDALDSHFGDEGKEQFGEHGGPCLSPEMIPCPEPQGTADRRASKAPKSPLRLPQQLSQVASSQPRIASPWHSSLRYTRTPPTPTFHSGRPARSGPW